MRHDLALQDKAIYELERTMFVLLAVTQACGTVAIVADNFTRRRPALSERNGVPRDVLRYAGGSWVQGLTAGHRLSTFTAKFSQKTNRKCLYPCVSIQILNEEMREISDSAEDQRVTSIVGFVAKCLKQGTVC